MTERITKTRWFWAWEYEKEERWLNEMAADGWTLAEVGYCRFTFERSEPNAYTIRLEMHPHDEQYLSFMEDTGAEYIGRCLQWVYFRRRSELGAFDLFSDLDSKLTHLRKIHKTILIVGILNLFAGMLNLFVGLESTSVYRMNNACVAVLNLLVCTFLMYGLGRLKEKIDSLERERLLRE